MGIIFWNYCWNIIFTRLWHQVYPSGQNPGARGSISPFSFYGQPPDYQSNAWSLDYPVDEFSCQEMRTWFWSKITSCCICVWCESEEIGGRRSPRFPYVTPVFEIFSLDRVSLRIPSNINDVVPLRKQPTTWTCWLFPQKGSTADLQLECKCGSDCTCCECELWVYC